MSNDTLIQIITKNNPEKVETILSSISRNTTLRTSKILLIDDSSDVLFNLGNRGKTLDTDLDIIHIDREQWLYHKKKILGILDSPFINDLEIGLSTWNTPNVRNVGLVYIASLLKEKLFGSVIHFDDDMDVSELEFFSDKISSSIEGIKIGGCPDLSRFEWIQLFIRASIAGKKIKTNTEDLEYADELVNSYRIFELEQVIDKYTDLNINTEYKGLQDGIKTAISSREEFSGGAYINSVGNLGLGVFPGVYNEDWCYANMIRRKLNQENTFYSGGKVKHASSRKNVLNEDELLKEEIGEFFQLYYRLGNRDAYKDIVNKKITLISKELDYCNLLFDFNSDISRIINCLQSLLKFYNKLKDDFGEIDKLILDYENNTNEWKKIHNILPGITL